MICYTRNFEDVLIQRAFSDVPNGSYIDVGASNPVFDSLTFALYEKGWRGVAIEPLPYLEFWKKKRPGDVLVNAAVGEKSGMLEFNVYDQGQQVSTGSPAAVAHWERSGYTPTRCIEVKMMTLDQIIAEHLPGRPIHLMTVDVEGMEHQALKGIDLVVHRPWLIVVESTMQGNPTPAHHSWEPVILQAGYLMAYFDGVNRYYVSLEQRHLVERFANPPNVWDQFEMIETVQLREQAKRQAAEIDRLRSELENAKAQPAASNTYVQRALGSVVKTTVSWT